MCCDADADISGESDTKSSVSTISTAARIMP